MRHRFDINGMDALAVPLDSLSIKCISTHPVFEKIRDVVLSESIEAISEKSFSGHPFYI